MTWRTFFLFGLLFSLALNGCSRNEENLAPSATKKKSAQKSTARKPREQNKSPIAGSADKSEQLKAENLHSTEQQENSLQPKPGTAPSPKFDRERLAKLGFESFESKSLLLFSDQIPASKLKDFEKLPDVIDQLVFRFKKDYPHRNVRTQLTCFIMRDRSLYIQAGLLPEEISDLIHGINKGSSFWLNEQKTNYYRRHLMIHEAVHSLMDLERHSWPVWYLEGMAEFYAIHRTADQKIEFGIAPGKEQIAGGFGRLQLLQDEVRAGRFLTIARIREFDFNTFYPHKTNYAWSWALCHFLATHPETKESFHQLMNYRSSEHFNKFFEQSFPAGDARLNAQWAVFILSLTPDFDIERSRITWDEIPSGNEIKINVERSWQNSSVKVLKGKKYTIQASGRYTVAQKPVPWECEPQGVSVEYVDGVPLGKVQAVLFSEREQFSERDQAIPFSKPISIGREATMTATTDGVLFFRINDRSSGWRDNRGTVSIKVTPETP